LALTGGAGHPYACRLLKLDRQCFSLWQPSFWGPSEFVAEAKFLAWIGGNLLHQIVCEGLRENNPAGEAVGRSRIPRTASQGFRLNRT